MNRFEFTFWIGVTVKRKIVGREAKVLDNLCMLIQ